MKKVTKYQTSDGSLFDTESEAKIHENFVKAKESYYDNKLLGNYIGSSVDWEDLCGWIDDNEEIVDAILKRNNSQ